MNVFLIVTSGILGGLASILLRISNGMQYELLVKGAAIASYGLGFICYALALKEQNITSTYPVMVGVSILLVFAYTAIYEKEISLTKIVATCFIFFGIYLITRKS